MARCMLKHAGAPPIFWAEAVNTACYIRNRCPTKSLDGKIPYKLWTGKTPSLSHMNVFGAKAYVLIKGNISGKFDSRSEECVLLGNSNESKAYRLWSPRKRNIIISRDVKILEQMYFKDEYENIHDECLQPTKDNENETFELPVENSEPPITNDHVSDNESEFEGFEDCNLCISGEPATINEIMQSGDESWIKAIEDEYISQLLNNTWNIVERPNNRKIIGNRFVFRVKEDNKKKVRLVAKGCSQRQGEDFADTYSPVVRSTSVRLLSALSTKLNLQIHQMDVVTAYLHGELDEKVFMEIPEHLINILELLSADKTIGSCKEKCEQVKGVPQKWLNAYKACKQPV